MALSLTWFLLLIAPAASTLSAWNSWDLDPTRLLLVSAWVFIALHLLLPPRLFLLFTYPLALFGVACVGADVLRDVNLLDLAAEWRTFPRAEIENALAPYGLPLIAAAACLAVLCALALRVGSGDRSPARVRCAGLLAGTAILVAVVPYAAWARAWPVNAVLVGVGSLGNVPGLAAYSTSATLRSPRRQDASWDARRGTAAATRQTVVLVIGESMRADYLEECGGPAKVRVVHSGALVACNATAGADATHTSVPLLVSREWPGHGVRVSDDATFQRALAQAAFATTWLGVQEQSIAWPDAATQEYVPGPDARLLPLLDEALASGQLRRSIVVHVDGAHSPYCARFDPRTAPYPDACGRLGVMPSTANIVSWKAMYADAVDASVGFLNTVIDRLTQLPGEVFLVYTPDHGENLLDDQRELYGHALRHPTRWEIQVPIVFWANAAWKANHVEEWRNLEANVGAALMHADVVPTLLAAEGVRYREESRPAANLLAGPPPARRRSVQEAIGVATDWQTLVREAADHR